MPTWTRQPVENLAPGEVLIFGSNRDGHHGMGVAGLAFRGNPDRHYDQDPVFIRAKTSPPGHPDRTGRYAVYGNGRGYQTGVHGASYAVETVRCLNPRERTPLREIYAQLQDLRTFAHHHPEWQFLITPLGTGLAGYGEHEMNLVWTTLQQRGGLPENFHFRRP